MPVFIRCQRLLKARALLRRLAVPLGKKSCLPQPAPYAGRTHRHDVCVEHHERQPAVLLTKTRVKGCSDLEGAAWAVEGIHAFFAAEPQYMSEAVASFLEKYPLEF